MRTVTTIAIFLLTSALASPRTTVPEGRTSWRASQSTQFRIGRFEVHDDPLLLAQAVSNRCVTPAVACLLAQTVPVGTPCWCATSNGPVSGIIR
jgi:hypothetical protein